MSLLVGLYHTDLKRVEEQTLNTMYEGVKHFPHKKAAFLNKKNAAFGHLLTYNTPEALFEEMPCYCTEEGTTLLFVAEARLDNREELANALGIHLSPTLPDGAIILKAYLKWGKKTPEKLLGDWSFACFDEATQELFIARDQHGYTTIFYHYEANIFSFASSKKSILALPHVKRMANQEQIIRGLALWFYDNDTIHNETIHKGIFFLPPAHTLTLKDGKIQLNRYWFPETIATIHRQNTQDYAEELRAILQEATRARLRSYHPVASMLSGGLDSSSVSFLAAELLQRQHQTLTTMSHVPLFKEELTRLQDPAFVLDETPFILATVAASGNIEPLLLASKHISPTDGIMKVLDCQDDTIHGASNAYWISDIFETAQREGFGSLLSGDMGNGGISYSGLNYLLPFTHPSFLRNPKQLVKTKVLKPLLLKYYPQLMETKENSITEYVKQHSYLHKNVLAEWQILAHLRKQNKGLFTYHHSSKSGMLDILDIGNNPRCMYGANSKHFYGVELRDPTGDVRVLEYCLSLPNDVFFDQQGNPKQLLKNTMKNRLPDKVLFEKKKGVQSSDINYRIGAERETINELLHRICQNHLFQEIIDTERLLADWQRMYSNPNNNLFSNPFLLKIMMVGLFLEQSN